jgi:hypothetical protein
VKVARRVARDAAWVLIPVALVLAVSGCGPVPTMRPEGQSLGQGGSGPPVLSDRPTYETARASIDVPVPIGTFARWFDQSGAPNLDSFLKGTAAVPGVVRSEPLIGSWHEAGDRRRLIFADGASALEQILDQGPQARRVEIWDLKNDTGRYIAYAVETFTLSETSTGTRVTWTTAFEPKVQPPDGWMIRSYVANAYQDFMQSGLNAMALRAIADIGSR